MLAYGVDLLIMSGLVVLLFMLVSLTLPIGAAIDKWIGGVFRDALQSARTAVQHPGSGGHFQGLTIAALLLTEYTVSTGYFIFWEMVTGGTSMRSFTFVLSFVDFLGMEDLNVRAPSY